jgi:hypothetical protein
MLASLCASITTFFGDCVKTWLGTLVDILIDIDLKQLHKNFNSHTQTLRCVKSLEVRINTLIILLLSHWVVLYWLVEHCFAHGSIKVRMVQEEVSWWIKWSPLFKWLVLLVAKHIL